MSGEKRKGDREWGRSMQRKRAARAQKLHYPTLVGEWARNANRARWGKPLKPLPDVGRLMKPAEGGVKVRFGNEEQA